MLKAFMSSNLLAELGVQKVVHIYSLGKPLNINYF